jgi:hypothetical protein
LIHLRAFGKAVAMAKLPATPARAALGFRAHTGWAAMVALGDAGRQPRILERQRLSLEDPSGRIPRFAYHAAADGGAKQGAAIVEAARAIAAAAAHQAVGRAIEPLRAGGIEVVAGAILTGGAPPPAELETILAAHTLIHAAEGALYREALIAACRLHDLAVVTIRERDLWRRAQPALGGDEAAVQAWLETLGRAAGRPWGQDQKMAAAAAWIALN